jgi:hypothetical protein
VAHLLLLRVGGAQFQEVGQGCDHGASASAMVL